MNKYLLALCVLVLASLSGKAQVDINTATLVTSSPNDCSSIQYSVTMTHWNANYTYSGTTTQTVNGTIYVYINYSISGPALPAIITVTQTVTFGPVGISGNNTPIVFTGVLNGSPNTSASLSSTINLGSCCPVSAGLTLSDTIACSGDQITVTNTTTGSTSSDIYLNGINIGSGASTLANITGSGPYEFKVVGTDGSCSDSSTVTIPEALLDIGVDDTICTNGARTLDAGADWANTVWSTGATTQSIQVNSTGTYTVTASTNNGCSKIDTRFLEYPNIPDIGNDTALCIGENITLDVGNNWDFIVWNDGSISSQLVVNSTGTYSVTVYDVGMTCQKNDHITVNVIGENFDVNDESLCPGDSATYALSGWDNYFWSTNETDSVIVIGTSGTYTVTVEHLNTNCLVVDTFTVDFSSQFFELTDTSICSNASFIASIGNGYSNIMWSTGAITSSILINAPGTYYVSATNQDGCLSTDTLVVSESDSIYFSLGADTTLCEGESIVIGGPVAGADNYLWTTGSAAETITVTSSGTYGLNVESDDGCVGYDEMDVEFIECTNSIDELEAGSVSIYPNPANQSFTITTANNLRNAEVHVYNSLGQKVQTLSMASSLETIDVSSLAVGNYIIQITSDEGVWQQHVLIQR